MIDLKAAKLQALARSMLEAGPIAAKDVEQLTRRALADGGLQAEERAALQQILATHEDRFEPAARDRLRAFLAITDEGLRSRFHALETDDGEIDVFDALELQKLAAGQGPLADGKRYTVSALMIGSRMTAAGERILDRLVDGRTVAPEIAAYLRGLEAGEARLANAPPALLADRQLLGIALALRPAAAEELPEALRQDPEVQIAALEANPTVFNYLPKPIRQRAVMLAALKCGRNEVKSRILAAAPELLADRELIRLALDINPWVLRDVADRYGTDREMVTYALAHGCPLRVVDESLWGEREIALAAVAHDPRSYRQLPEAMRRDREIARLALAQDAGSYRSLPAVLQLDRELARVAIEGRLELKHLSPELRADAEIVLAAIKARGGDQLRHSSRRADRDLARAALRIDGAAYEHLAPALRADRELALLAVSHENRRAIAALPEQLLLDREILLTAMANNRSAFEAIPAPLLADRAFLLQAVALAPKVLERASEALQRDPELALAAATAAGRHGGLRIDSSLLADRAFLVRLLAVHPHSLRQAPVAARGDRQLVGAVVAAFPEALGDAADALRNDRDFVAPLVERSGAFLKYAGRALQDDGELARRALIDHPYVFPFLSRRLQHDPELARLAVSRNGKVYESLPPAMKKDVAVIEVALRYYGQLSFAHVPREMIDHPAVLRAALISSPALVNEMPRGTYFSDDLLRQVAARNPLIFDYFPSRRRSLPDLAAEYDALKRRLGELEIDFPQRIRPLEVLREVIRNRTEPRAPDDQRPLALVIYPKTDHNGAFEINSIAELMPGYRVVYHEAHSDTDLQAVLETTAASGERAELVVIGGHGTREFTAFGATDPAKDTQREHESEYLDLTDGPQLRAGLAGAVRAGGHVVLHSCSTGQGRDREENVANFVARLAPQAFVYAPTNPTNSQLIFDAQGRFRSPGYWRGSEETYVVPPTA